MEPEAADAFQVGKVSDVSSQKSSNHQSDNRCKGCWTLCLLLLFFGSGSACLIYEVVWFQLLELIVGSSAISLGILLGVFMGGLCLGSLGLPRFVPQNANPLRTYAILEIAIGAFGLGILILARLLVPWYASLGGSGLTGIFVRALLCGICLLPPTILMGATLPAVSRAVESTAAGMAKLSFFYAANVAGAVFG